VHKATVKRKNSLLTGRNLWQKQTQGGRPSASTSWGLRGQERGDSRHHNTRPGTLAEKDKQKLMTTILLYVDREKREQSEESCIMGGPQQARPVTA